MAVEPIASASEAATPTWAPWLLMCEPRYYGIEYEINVWMSRARSANRRLALQQWRALHTHLTEDVGARVDLIEPIPGLPDMCFTANAGLVYRGAVVVSNFRHPERQGEAEQFRRWFERAGFAVLSLPNEVAFEGEGDALIVGDEVFAGYRFRSDIHAHRMVGELLGMRVISLELVDPRFYHLDTCFCPLRPGMAIYYPHAFDGYGQRLLADRFPDAIRVSEEDAVRFGCNAIVLGDTVVLNAGCDRLNADLRDRGYRVIATPLGEFLKAGGAAKCLVLYLSRGEAEADQ